MVLGISPKNSACFVKIAGNFLAILVINIGILLIHNYKLLARRLLLENYRVHDNENIENHLLVELNRSEFMNNK